MYHRIAHVAPEEDPRGLSVTPAMFAQHMAALHEGGYRCLRLEEAALRWQQHRSQPSRHFVLTFDDGYRDLLTDVAPILEQFDFTATVFLVTDYVGQTNAWEQIGPNTVPLLNWEEIHDLDRRCLDFGSHTATHPRLRDLDGAAVEAEVQRSKATLEAQLGRPVTLFAYPYGNHDNRVRRIVSKAGYLAACGVDRGVWSRYNVWR
ncbi:MAG: polysaccharide deacetylase family protein, partial [Anaerolineae bacterium]|nr:polysaccharide deacetylase family protein [Anaerolineae bacterium]